FFETFMAPFPSETRLFHTAERSRGVRGYAVVDTDQTGLQLVGDVQCAVEVFGEHVSGQAEWRVVGPLNHLFLCGEAGNRRNGTENLGIGDVGVERDPIQHSRLEEIAGAVRSTTAGAQIG